MGRPPASGDVFAAIAEPRRRELLGLLAQPTDGRGESASARGAGAGERDVTWLVDELGWTQPQVSKHLAVLREAGLVSVVRRGRRRMYSVNGEKLRSVYEWAKGYERYWDHQLLRIKERAERMERAGANKARERDDSGHHE